MIDLIVQRFQPGHLFFTDKEIENKNPKTGIVGSFKSSFGQLINANTGDFLAYTMERRDTLISEGKRKFKLYYSPANKTNVLLFEDEPQSNTYKRYFEMHIANYAYQLRGCTSVGNKIILSTPMIADSKKAFDRIMLLAGNGNGSITHEKLI